MCIYASLMCACAATRAREMGNARETERGKRQTALHSDVRAGTARRTKGVGNPRASERAGPVRTTADYIDFDFRRRAHLVLSGSVHSCRSRLPSYRGHWSCPRAKRGPRRIRISWRVVLRFQGVSNLFTSANAIALENFNKSNIKILKR